MAKRNEDLKVERVFVHFDNDGNRIERRESEIPEEELRSMKIELVDRFMASFGYMRKTV